MTILKKLVSFILPIALAYSPAYAQEDNKDMKELIRNNFELARDQYKYLSTLIPADQLPQSFDEKTGKVISREISWWCSGFYPGSLWYVYEQTGDSLIKKEALRSLKLIEPNQYFTGNHDLGFMMYCSFGNAYRLTGDTSYVRILTNASNSLASRYRPSIHCIQSWNKNQYFNCPVIIDNMMNLEMLNWVSQKTGEQRFKEIAEAHANTTMKNQFRKDYSSYHVVDYDLEKGTVIRKATFQGAANSSAWARGQAWGLYGYVTMYRFSHQRKYLEQAKHIAHFILNHPNLPADKIPYWDFDAPYMPLAKRDASAASIMVSAFLELAQYCSGNERKELIGVSKQILLTLSSPQYRYEKGQGGGFLIKHGVGALPLNSEIDVPLIYADYYFLEALKRYKDWYLDQP